METMEAEHNDHYHDYATEYTIISGMGKGVYVINLDSSNSVNFQTKISVVSGAINIGLSFVSFMLFALAF